MNHFIKSLGLTADMIQRRDDMRRLLGPAYLARSGEARAVIRGVAKARDIDITAAALKIAKQMSGDGHDPSIIIAGLVEELEAGPR